MQRLKEDMRKTFYDKGNEEAVLKWRPSNVEAGCVDSRRCRRYSWESFEDEYFEDYIRDIKVDEIVSDTSSDEEFNCSTCSKKRKDSQRAVMFFSEPITNRFYVHKS